MKKRFLVTTALEETWRTDEPVLFLGEWCRRHSRRVRWSSLDAAVAPYHWDDRAKLLADYHYLRELHEELLPEIAAQLDRIHRTRHGLRYWRILLGPWLGFFIQILFDRWSSIREVVGRYDLSGSVVLDFERGAMVPSAMDDFEALYAGDEWNHFIYGLILREFPAIPLISAATERAERPKDALGGKCSAVRPLRAWLGGLVTRGAALLVRPGDAFFLASYLPPRTEAKLYRRLGQVPQFWRRVPPVRAKFAQQFREWSLTSRDAGIFSAWVRRMIPGQMPTAYLEGYRELVGQVARLPWPKNPKLIWTSNADVTDDVFKAWAAEKCEQGAPLAIGQHGGNYGIGLWSFLEEHQMAISDCYLSWGWSSPGRPQIRPVGQIKLRPPLGVAHAKQSRAILVTTIVPRYSYWMFSVIVARQWLDYFADQCAFVADLPPVVRQALTVRLHPQDFGWDQLLRWRQNFPDIRIDEGGAPIDQLIRETRIYISTYNATTFLESISMDVPTVIFWNPANWELRDSAQPYFADLARVGIFHRTPGSAARHVASIWDDIEAWWRNPELQEVVQRFKRNYCHLPDDILDGIEAAFRPLMAPGAAALPP